MTVTNEELKDNQPEQSEKPAAVENASSPTPTPAQADEANPSAAQDQQPTPDAATTEQSKPAEAAPELTPEQQAE